MCSYSVVKDHSGRPGSDVVLFTTSVQVPHLFAIAAEMQVEDLLRKALVHGMVASIGPICSEMLLDHGVHVDMEPSHPRMGVLVREAAERSAPILAARRDTKAGERSRQAALQKSVGRVRGPSPSTSQFQACEGARVTQTRNQPQGSEEAPRRGT